MDDEEAVHALRKTPIELPGQVSREDAHKDMDARKTMDLLTKPLERSGYWR